VFFLKEVVPHGLIALGARWLYNEPYVQRPMQQTDDGTIRTYSFQEGGRTHRLHARRTGEAVLPAESSVEDFIKEQYWGFGVQRGRTKCYPVAHPRWRVLPCTDFTIDTDFAAVYGKHWALLNETPPWNTCWAEGSAITIGVAQRVG
jgi:hypothetical protein